LAAGLCPDPLGGAIALDPQPPSRYKVEGRIMEGVENSWEEGEWREGREGVRTKEGWEGGGMERKGRNDRERGGRARLGYLSRAAEFL